MNSIYKRVIILLSIVIIFGVLTYIANSYRQSIATITSRLPSSVLVNQSIELPILIDTKDETINAAEVYLTYDPAFLTVTEVTKKDSFFQLWVDGEPSFSKEKSQITFAGGLPTPGFRGKGQIGTVQFTPTKRGQTTIVFAEKTRVLLNDGKGTKIPLRLSPITITVR